MIEAILPTPVVSVEAREDPPDVVLLPGEEAEVEHAVEKRRREYATARSCAREALGRLGLPPAPITTGENGEPRWPAGVVGSITHCDGYRACAVARAESIATVGIDAEPNAPLPQGVLPDVAGAAELGRLRHLRRDAPGVHWDRLLFSAKESVYKAWFPLMRRWLGFEDADVTIDAAAGAFRARLLVPGPLLGGRQVASFPGRWLVRDGLVITAVALAALPSDLIPAPPAGRP
jgi:4'-phosphopantetheinyl transferase EntD